MACENNSSMYLTFRQYVFKVELCIRPSGWWTPKDVQKKTWHYVSKNASYAAYTFPRIVGSSQKITLQFLNLNTVFLLSSDSAVSIFVSLKDDSKLPLTKALSQIMLLTQ